MSGLIRNLKFISILFIVIPLVLLAGPRKNAPKLPPKPVLDVPYSENLLTRVDPHGAKNIKPTLAQAQTTNECMVCHLIQENKLKTKTTALESCFNCHNHSPHSGVVEHLKHKVSCTDCHTFHRGEGMAEAASDSGLFAKVQNKKPESGLVIKKNKSAMLKKQCIECHKY